MKANKWLPVVALLATAGFGAWLWVSRAPESAPVAAAPVTANVRKPEPDAPANTPEAQPKTSVDGGRRAGEVLLQLAGNGHVFDPTDPNNAATSEADAAWLHKAGFLDPKAYRTMRDASIEELEDAAKTDLRAQVILAYNMAVAGGYGERPLVLLEDAAARGSVFALMTWGDIHYTVDGYRNPALGNAYYRLAYRRGYFTAATANYSFSRTLSSEMRLVADVYSEATWSRLQALRIQRGLQPFRDTELRPGFEAFLAQVEAGLREQQRQQQELND